MKLIVYTWSKPWRILPDNPMVQRSIFNEYEALGYTVTIVYNPSPGVLLQFNTSLKKSSYQIFTWSQKKREKLFLKEEFIYNSLHQASHLVPNNSCTGQVGWSSEQPGLVENVPAHGRGAGSRWSLTSLPTQTILWFYEIRKSSISIDKTFSHDDKLSIFSVV